MKPTYHVSFEKVCRLLQITIPVQDYYLVSRHRIYSELREDSDIVDFYWRRLPEYLIAHCPLCEKEYKTIADTHGIDTWLVNSLNYRDVFTSIFQPERCRHFICVNTSVNLNGNFPTEVKSFQNHNFDIPIFNPELLPDDMRSAAVIHSLPICRIEAGQYVPRYSVYMISYFAEHANEAYHRAMKIKYPPSEEIDDGYHPGGPFGFRSPYRPSELKNLKRWVKARKLYWLDLDDPALPLRTGDVEKFPYHGIKGFGTPYTYWKRERPDHWWQRLRWHPDGEIWDYGRLLAKPDW